MDIFTISLSWRKQQDKVSEKNRNLDYTAKLLYNLTLITDHQVKWANLGSDKVKRFVTRHTATDKVVLLVLGSDNSFKIHSDEEVVVVGNVSDDGKLDLAKKEEFFNFSIFSSLFRFSIFG